jgi:hypothetical protein
VHNQAAFSGIDEGATWARPFATFPVTLLETALGRDDRLDPDLLDKHLADDNGHGYHGEEPENDSLTKAAVAPKVIAA